MAKYVVNSRLSFARNFILAEKSRLRSSPLLQAAKRYGQVAPTFLLLTRKKSQWKIPVSQVSRKWILDSKRCLEMKLPVEN